MLGEGPREAARKCVRERKRVGKYKEARSGTGVLLVLRQSALRYYDVSYK
jgi:hypothetical protein